MAVKAVQQFTKGFHLAARRAILPDGHKGIGFGHTGGVLRQIWFPLPRPQTSSKIDAQFFCRFRQICAGQPALRIPQHRQGNLPADQRGQASKSIHQPVCQPVRPRRLEKGLKIRQFRRICLVQGHWWLIIESRQSLAAGRVVQADPAQAIQDSPLPIQQVEVGGSAHQLHHQLPAGQVSHFIGAGKDKADHPLHGGLFYGNQTAAGQVLPQQHTKHRRAVRVFPILVGKVQSRGRRIGHNHQPLPAGVAPQQENHRIPGRLVNFLHSGASSCLAYLIQNGRQKGCVKCHTIPPLP